MFVAMWMGAGKNAALLGMINDGCAKAFGFTQYLFPIIFVYIAVMIFRSPNNKLDLSVWIASGVIVVLFCGLFGVGSYGTPEMSGGYIGKEIGRAHV